MNRVHRRALFRRPNGRSILGEDLLQMNETQLLAVFQEARATDSINCALLSSMSCHERQETRAQRLMNQRSVARLIASDAAIMIIEAQLARQAAGRS
jgi:hypothetical protein